MSHLATDSIDLVRFGERLNLPRGSVFHKCDVEEFYMSGDHGVLADDYAEVVPREVVAFLNGAQYVVSQGVTAKVVSGSGMSDEHIGAVSDFSFYQRAERNFLLSRDVRTRYGILGYIRYRDDFLIVSGFEPFLILLPLVFWVGSYQLFKRAWPEPPDVTETDQEQETPAAPPGALKEGETPADTTEAAAATDDVCI